MKFSEYEQLRFERRDHGVLLITMDRPDKYNAADEQMHGELARVWAEVSADPETRVAVITGAGRAFSAGGDLDMVRRMAGDHDRVAHMLREMSDLVYNIINCEKPVVSAINGVAVGAGTVVALLADISICALDARLGDGHVRLGVAAGDHAAILWPLLCGMAKARYYLLTGEMITGEEAERLGMVSKAVPRDQVLDEALRVADSLATGSQPAIRWTKRALNNWLKMAGPIFDQSAAYEMLTFMGPDVVEGAAALTEKRPPRFPSAQDAQHAGYDEQQARSACPRHQRLGARVLRAALPGRHRGVPRMECVDHQMHRKSPWSPRSRPVVVRWAHAARSRSSLPRRRAPALHTARAPSAATAPARTTRAPGSRGGPAPSGIGRDGTTTWTPCGRRTPGSPLWKCEAVVVLRATRRRRMRPAVRTAVLGPTTR